MAYFTMKPASKVRRMEPRGKGVSSQKHRREEKGR